MSLEDRRAYTLNCDRCSHCKWVPGTKSEKFAQSCPSIQYGNFHSYSAVGKLAIAFGLLEKRLSYSEQLVNSVYDCTMCGACDVGCKWNHGGTVEPLETLYELRARIAGDGKVPLACRRLIDNVLREGNRYGKPRADRAKWAKGLDIPDVRRRRSHDVLLHIGCENAYSEESRPDLVNLVQWLRTAGVDFAIAYEDEQDTGELAFDLGFQREARDLASSMASLIARSGAKTVVTCSASSYAAFRNIYPRLGIKVEATTLKHVSDFLSDLMATGALPLKLAASRKVTYHDPCKLGRLSEIYTPWSGKIGRAYNQLVVTDPVRPGILFGNFGNYDSARQLLARVDGLELIEMERTKRSSYCCGAGAGAAEANAEFAEHTALHRLDEAQSTGADLLVSACGNCTRHLKQVASKNSIPLEVKTLFEFLSDAVIKESSAAAAAEGGK